MTKEQALDKLIEMFSNLPEEHNQYELKANKDEFILKIPINDSYILCCLKELSWKESMEIEAFSFREDNDGDYFSGEYEKREILKKTLVWIYSVDEARVEYNDSYGQLLAKIKYDIIDKIYQEYFRYINIDAKEANYIYNTALKYFNGTAQEDRPVIPLIVEVDYMAKGIVTISRDEFAKLSISEFEKIQLILAARADALKLAPTQIDTSKNNVNVGGIMDNLEQYMQTLPKRAN